MGGKIHQNITELVGHTPLLRLNGYERSVHSGAQLIAKLEFFNPNQSIKDRIAKEIIEEAETSGQLKKGGKIVEVTSGNTGIAFAGLAAALGYDFQVFIQDQVSVERTEVIRALGGKVTKLGDTPEVRKVLDETDGDFVAATAAFKKNVLSHMPDTYFVNQCANEGNEKAHEKTTGPEIWEDTDGQVDIVVACAGTGGTVSGVGKYLKSRSRDVKIVAVEPGTGSTPTKENPRPREITGIHRYIGIPEENIPKNLNRSVIDETIDVEAGEAYEAARRVAKTDGILVGTSSGAALHAAELLAKRPENAGKNIVVIMPDTGLRYLSTDLFET